MPMLDKTITVRQLPGTYVVRAGGAVLAESTAAMELSEGNLPPVIFLPRADIAMAFLEPSPTRSSAGAKGEAEFYTIFAKSGPIADAAWSFPAPGEAFQRIAGLIAFDTDRVAVERV